MIQFLVVSLFYRIFKAKKNKIKMAVLKQTRTMKDGREFHNDSSSKYWLPSDDEEADRLTNVSNILLHNLIRASINTFLQATYSFEEAIWRVSKSIKRKNCSG